MAIATPTEYLMARQYHYEASVISLAFARRLRRVSRMVSLAEVKGGLLSQAGV
jgi:hypothetical protein